VSPRAVPPGAGREPAERLVLRLGLFAAGVISWRASQGIWLSGVAERSEPGTLLQLAAGLWGFLLLACSVLRPLPRRVAWLVPTGFLLAAGVQFWGDAGNKLLAGGTITTDGHIYLDHAARLLRRGVNPYGESMLEAYRVHRTPLTFSTPLVSGDLTDRLPYPALSFLLFVPFQWLGIPTYLVFFIFLCAALALLYRSAPPLLQPVVLLPFFVDDSFLNYSLGGVSDTVWAFFLVLCVLSWERGGTRRSLWYGLACACKQHPWLLAPFLAIRIWHETPGTVARRVRALIVFFGGAAAVFLVINAPFALWDFRSWSAGLLEPLRAPMMAVGQGLTALSIRGVVSIRRADFAVMQWGVFGLLAWVYSRHFARLRPFAWLAPSLALWFGHRSLTSYWYFNVFPLVAELMRRPAAVPPAGAGARASARTSLAVSGAAVALVAGWLWREQLLPGALEISSLGPAYAPGGRFVSSLRLRVRNRSERAIRPAFTVQPARNQSHRWSILRGPSELRPGQTGRYAIAAPRSISFYDLTRGSRLAVFENGAYEPRATALIPGEPDALYPDAIPNGGFSVWTGGVPTYWWLVRQGDPEATVVPQHTPRGIAVRLRPGPVVPGARRLGIGTQIVLPEHPVTFSVFLPEGANVEDRMDVLYGVRVRVRDRSHLILFGDREGAGTVGGLPFRMLRAPRGAWSSHEVELRPLLASLGADLAQSRAWIFRFEHLDIPVAYPEVELFLCVPPGVEAPPARFGPVANGRLKADPDRITGGGPAAAAEIEAWRGGLTLDAGSPGLAMEHFSRALSLAPRGEYSLGLAEAAARAGRDAEAEAAYRAAIEAGWEVGRAQAGLGEVLARRGRNPQALEAFAEAVRELDRDAGTADGGSGEEEGCFPTPPPGGGKDLLAGALRGLVLAAARENACDEVRDASERLAALGRRPPQARAVARCLGERRSTPGRHAP